jgi:hypothetical protein
MQVRPLSVTIALLRKECQKIQGFIYSTPVNPNGFE